MSLPSSVLALVLAFVALQSTPPSGNSPDGGPVHAERNAANALLGAVRAQMPTRNGIPRKDDPPLATDDGPIEDVYLAEDVQRDLLVRELADERTDSDTGDPVALHNGMVSHRVVDLHIAGRGLDFELARRYDSHRAPGASVLGFGWQHSFDIAVRFQGATAELSNGNGRLDVYTRTDAQHYAAPPGSYTRLAWDAGASAWILRTRHGVKTAFQSIAGDVAGVWRAVWIEERHGNRLALEYASGGRLDAVVDTLGRRIVFVYDAAGRLERVRDFVGREVVYAYDARGDLVSVRSPVVNSTQGFADAPHGLVESYSYHASPPVLAHHLAAIVHRTENAAGTGEPFVRFEYERAPSSPFVGWVKAQFMGRASAASAIHYGYALSNTQTPFGTPSVVRITTTVTDRLGHVAHYAFNENGNALSIREQLDTGGWVETHFDYDANGEVTRVVRPEGDAETRTYQGGSSPFACGNLVRIDRVRGPRPADQDVRTVQLEWEPVFQHALSRTDERGMRTQWSSDWMEGDAVPSSANDVRLDIARELDITPEEATSQAGPWLRGTDLNGDGVRAVVRGDLLQRIEPTVALSTLAGAPQATAEGDAQQIAIHSATYDVYGRVTTETDAEENVNVRLYTSAADLDGDGVIDIDAPHGADPVTGGWLACTVEDTSLPFAHAQLAGVNPRALPSDVRRNCGRGPSPAPIERTIDRVHDRLGRLTAEIDARGVRTDYAFDELDRCWQCVRAADVSAAAMRHGGCNPALSEDLTGQDFAFVSRTRFDPDGRVELVLEQNSGDEPDRGAVPDFHETSFTYDIEGRLTAQAEEYGEHGELATRTFVRDANGNLTSEIDPEGHEVRSQFDARGRCVSRTRGFGTPEAASETITYDGNGNVIEHRDGRGFATSFGYDGFDRLVLRRDAASAELSIKWDAASNAVATTDRGVADGSSTAIVDLRRAEYAYDERSRLARIDRIDPRHPLTDGALTPGDGRVTTALERDRLDRITFRIGDDAAIDALSWDGASRPISRCDARLNRIDTCFDDADHGVLTTQSDVYPDGHVRVTSVERVFDALGRLVETRDALGHAERSVYASRALPIATVDAAGNTARCAHDGLGRTVREVRDLRIGGTATGAIDHSNPFNPDGAVSVSRSWDRCGRLVAVTDDRGSTTRFEYDALGRNVREIAPGGAATVFEHDDADGIVAIVDPRGCRSEMVRDAVGRVVAVNRVTTTAAIVGSEALRFEYDGLGRRTRSVDSVDAILGNADDWTVVRAFDALGRVLNDDQNGRVVHSTWRVEGERTALVYPSGMQLALAHDDLHRVTSISQGSTEIAHYEYAGRERRLVRRLANGIETRAADAGFDDSSYCDAALRPLRLDHLDATGLAARFEETLDALGRRTSERRVHAGGRGDNAEYDSLGRLVRCEHGVAAKDVGVLGSNRARDVETWTLDGAHDWRANSAYGREQHSNVDVDGAYTEFGAERPAHDASGNLVVLDAGSAQPVLLEYDFLNRLRRIAQGAASMEHDYDAEGRRVRTRTMNVPGAPASVSYVYDDWREIEQWSAAGTVSSRTVHGVRPSEPLRIEVAGVGVLFLLDSPSGDVAAVTDASGHVLERVTYDAYGMPRFETASSARKFVARSECGNPYLFKGQRFDPWILPLFDARSRVYAPRHGRFVQRDPIGAWTDAANGGNPYAFVASDPWNCEDPLGLEKLVPVWVHEGLSWVGFLPGVGAGSDALDGLLYLCEGDYGQAAFAAAAMVPFFGDGFAGARKVAKLEQGLVETKKLKKVGGDVVERLKKVGEHPHDLKSDAGGSLSDIYRDRAGELYSGNKDGTGFAESLWINLKELFE